MTSSGLLPLPSPIIHTCSFLLISSISQTALKRAATDDHLGLTVLASGCPGGVGRGCVQQERNATTHAAHDCVWDDMVGCPARTWEWGMRVRWAMCEQTSGFVMSVVVGLHLS